jgi:cobalt/nickel transport system permease protein
MFMQPIHLAIGLVEGFVTAAVIGYVWNARPELVATPTNRLEKTSVPMKKVLLVLTGCVVVMGAIISLLASANPDGLEWAIGNVTGEDSLQAGGAIHDFFAGIQEKIAFLPDYQFKNGGGNGALGTSVSGILGGLMTLLLAVGIAFAVRRFSTRKMRDHS